MVTWPHVLQQNIIVAAAYGPDCFSLLGKQEAKRKKRQEGRRTHSQ